MRQLWNADRGEFGSRKWKSCENSIIVYIFQYCEFWPEKDKCHQWLEKNLPDEFSKLNVGGSGGKGDESAEEKKKQKRGETSKIFIK